MTGADTITLLNQDGEIVDKIKKRIQNEPNLSHINILIEIMESLEDSVGGASKKAKAIVIYEKVLVDLDMHVEEDKLVDQTIDIVVDLTKGKYNINKIKRVGLSCLPNLFHCLPSLFRSCKK